MLKSKDRRKGPGRCRRKKRGERAGCMYVWRLVRVFRLICRDGQSEQQEQWFWRDQVSTLIISAIIGFFFFADRQWRPERASWVNAGIINVLGRAISITDYLLLCRGFKYLMMNNNENNSMIIIIIMSLFNYFFGYCWLLQCRSPGRVDLDV